MMGWHNNHSLVITASNTSLPTLCASFRAKGDKVSRCIRAFMLTNQVITLLRLILLLNCAECLLSYATHAVQSPRHHAKTSTLNTLFHHMKHCNAVVLHREYITTEPLTGLAVMLKLRWAFIGDDRHYGALRCRLEVCEIC